MVDVKGEYYSCSVRLNANEEGNYILGDLFMKEFYTILDNDRGAIGLTESVNSTAKILNREDLLIQ